MHVCHCECQLNSLPVPLLPLNYFLNHESRCLICSTLKRRKHSIGCMCFIFPLLAHTYIKALVRFHAGGGGRLKYFYLNKHMQTEKNVHIHGKLALQFSLAYSFFKKHYYNVRHRHRWLAMNCAAPAHFN